MSGMKKILVMAKGSDMGGIEKSLIEFLKFLKSEGHKVYLYLLNLPGVLFDDIPPGIDIISSGVYPDALGEVTLKNLPNYIRFKIAERTGRHNMYAVNVKDEFDLAVSYGHNSPVPYLLVDKIKADKKILFFMHGEYCPAASVREKDEKYFSKFDYIVTDSRSNKLMFAKEFPGLADRIWVIYNIIDEESIRNLAYCEEVYNEIRIKNIPVICTVGRLSEEKGQLNALKAARMLHEKGFDFRWYFIGGGLEYEKVCRRFIVQNGLEKKCIMTGTLTNVYPYLSQCDLYVQPSRIEASGISIREAAILGRPIVATDIPAFRELEDTISSIELYDPTPEGIAHGVEKYLESGVCGSVKELRRSGARISESDESKGSIRRLIQI